MFGYQTWYGGYIQSEVSFHKLKQLSDDVVLQGHVKY